MARVSATLQVLTPERFLMAQLVDWEVLEMLRDVLGVLAVDRVVPNVVRFLVSWLNEEWMSEDDVLVVRGK